MMGIYLQGWFPSIPAQVFQVAPFPLMIFALALMSFTQNETVRRWAGGNAWMSRRLTGIANRSPTGLGRHYRPG